jgi:hypothetical protein
MGLLQPTPFYLALVTLITLRYIASGVDVGDLSPTRRWLRDVVIALVVATAGHLVPAHSPLMSVLMMLAYLVGFMVLTLWLYRRFENSVGGSIAGHILVIMVCLVVAMIAMALPILLLAKLGIPGIASSAAAT